jgi:E3 ubiquitin-protein ligase RGLG
MHIHYDMFEGPTSFSPIIEMATTIVEQSGGQYHVLVIIADGQVHRCLSPFVFL